MPAERVTPAQLQQLAQAVTEAEEILERATRAYRAASHDQTQAVNRLERATSALISAVQPYVPKANMRGEPR